MKNERPTWCHLLFYSTSYVLNMFRTLIYPSYPCASARKTSTTQNQTHQISNTRRTENKTTDVVIQQHSRKLLMMDILMSKTRWAHKKWNKIASDIKLVFHSSTITMMHGPINIRFIKTCSAVVSYMHTGRAIVTGVLHGCDHTYIAYVEGLPSAYICHTQWHR